MKNITYRLAGEQDIETIIHCREAFFTEFWGKQPVEVVDKFKAEMRAYFKQAIPNKSYLCWLAKNEDQPAGAGGLVIRQQPGSFKNPSGITGYIMSMYTFPGYRRQGVASNILNRLTATAKDMGIKAFELHATQEGAPVYIKNGFLLHNEPTYRKHEL